MSDKTIIDDEAVWDVISDILPAIFPMTSFSNTQKWAEIYLFLFKFVLYLFDRLLKPGMD